MSEDLDKYFKHTILPDKNLHDCWEKIIIPASTKDFLMNYAKAIESMDDISPIVSSLHKSILFYGDTGTGKSTSARGYANQIIEKIWSEKEANLFILEVHALFSEWEGRSPKELAQAFDLVEFAARHKPTILIVDEIESIAYQRSGMIQSGDPTDLIRVVNTLLRKMDELRNMRRVLLIGTSNFSKVIDEAMWDRFDLKIEFKRPGRSGRSLILQNCFEEFSKVGLKLKTKDASIVAKYTDGLSPRSLSKVVWWASALKGKSYEKLTVKDIIKAARDLSCREIKKMQKEGGVTNDGDDQEINCRFSEYRGSIRANGQYAERNSGESRISI